MVASAVDAEGAEGGEGRGVREDEASEEGPDGYCRGRYVEKALGVILVPLACIARVSGSLGGIIGVDVMGIDELLCSI